MAFTVLNFETNDYEAWKSMFDSDPAGRRQAGKGHIVSRNADNPNEVFVRVEFDSVDDARAFRDRLVGSGALDNPSMRVKMGPTGDRAGRDRHLLEAPPPAETPKTPGLAGVFERVPHTGFEPVLPP